MTILSVCLEQVSLFFPMKTSSKNPIKNMFGKISEKTSYAALNCINLNVEKGEIVGILGKNGSGKTTLLKTIARIYRPDKGRVLTSGRATLLSNIQGGMNEQLTGIENIKLRGAILGFTSSQIENFTEDIIKFADIGQFINQPLKTYSSGMRTRLGFAITCFAKPEIILLDETMAVGDHEFTKKSKRKIFEMVKSDATAIIATHSESVLRLVCDRVIYLENGKQIPVKDTEHAIRLYRGEDEEE